MKNLKYRIGFFASLFLLFSSCEEDRELGDVVTPSNLEIDVVLTGQDADNPRGDGSGELTLTATADDALSYSFVYNNTTSVAANGIQGYTFGETGVYDITVIASGTAGMSTSKIVQVDILVDYQPPAALLIALTGSDDTSSDSSKTWRIQSEENGHFGLGPLGSVNPEYYAAGPDEKADVGMYDDRYIFYADGTYKHTTEGTVFGREVLIEELAGAGGTQEGSDILNYPYGEYTGTWFINAPNDIVTINLSGTSFIGYYVGGNHKYEIFEYSEDSPTNSYSLRTVDGNIEFDWWFTITSDPVGGTDPDPFVTGYTTEVWKDDFDVDGVPDPAKWTYDLGMGSNGWGNGESQSYTNAADNISISDGMLKITAKKEGAGYTSARIKTENLYEFTYGRVEARAKLPSGGGTWPAIWMLGEDYASNIWPGCGEMDIMEHVGNNQNEIFATLHYDGRSGGNGVTSSIADFDDVSEAFHTYTIDWSPEEIVFLMDDIVYHRVPNNASLPFDSDFFLIMNVAIGGSFGGTIDPAFTESSMEVDYIRVYQ